MGKYLVLCLIALGLPICALAEDQGSASSILEQAHREFTTALELHRQGELNKATERMESFVDINTAVLGPNAESTVKGRLLLAIWSGQQGDPRRAQMLSEPIVHQDALSDAGRETLALLESLAGVFFKARYIEDAKSILQRVVSIREQDPTQEPEELARTLDRLSGLLEITGDLEPAMQFAERLLELQKSRFGIDHRETAAGYDTVARIQYKSGELWAAKATHEKALDIRTTLFGERSPEAAGSLYEVGSTLLELGRYVEARDKLGTALEIRREKLGSDHLDTAESLNAVALLLAAEGNFSEAQNHLQQALEIARKHLPENHSDLATGLANLATMISVTGDLGTAHRHTEQALAMHERRLGADHWRTASTRAQLGAIAANLGDLEQAEECFASAWPVLAKMLGRNHHKTLEVRWNLGALLLERGEARKAVGHLKQCRAATEENFNPVRPFCLSDLARASAESGDLDSARADFRRALHQSEQLFGPSHPLALLLRGDFARFLFWDLRRPLEARQHFERGWQEARRVVGARHVLTASLAFDLSGLHLVLADSLDDQQGADAKHAYHLEQAIVLAEEALEGFEAMIQLNAYGLSEKQQRLFLERFGSSHAISLHLAHAPGDPRAARLALETVWRFKGRSLEAALDAQSQVAVSDPRFEELRRLRSSRGYLLMQSAFVGPAARRTYLEKLDQEIASLERDLASSFENGRSAVPSITVENIQAKLKPKATLVELSSFFLLKNPSRRVRDQGAKLHYAASVLSSTGDPQWVDLGPVEVIEGVVREFLEAITSGGDVGPPAKELFRRTIGPVEHILEPAAELIISPDGLLQAVPFAALVDATGNYLVERHSLSYLSSGRDLLQQRAAEGSRQPPLLVGAPDFGECSERGAKARSEDSRWVDLGPLCFGRLDHTLDEVVEIGGILGLPDERILSGEHATEAAIKNVQGPKILHLATHGFFVKDTAAPADNRALTRQPEPAMLRSGLALGGANSWNRKHQADSGTFSGLRDDGLLTALELRDLDLHGTEVVVLSACETGMGTIRHTQGVLGLRRALVLAGSESQVMTLWKVADEPTKELMVSWYRQLDQGVARSKALRRVQLAVLKGKPLPETGVRLRGRGSRPLNNGALPADSRHPYYWASFILAGKTGPLADAGEAFGAPD